ncbi:hypothetical protein B0H15DRAFT_954937 [Mycena belliarum]|uniref:Uncharacterized protein n=1 Tax=Mycena belliarum TaxID=1033014 RepID=A0AAD6XKJ8_9AGAR|nr:hypothetical protein B0H15DRAFT_954937 [Mycena belliae]
MDEILPALPPELEREVFETTALMYPGAIPTLLRVARRVFIWVEPLLYRVVRVSDQVVHSDSMAAALLSAARSAPPGGSLRGVRHLLCAESESWTLEDAKDVLKHCAELTDLSLITSSIPLDATILPVLEGLRIHRLAAHLAEMFSGTHSIDLSHPAFSSITHLDIGDEVDDRLCSQIALMPALTHLMQNGKVPWVSMLMVFGQCQLLQVIIVNYQYLAKDAAIMWATQCPKHDARLVVAFYYNYEDDWELGARDLPDIWSLATDFVARKRKGDINVGDYILQT